MVISLAFQRAIYPGVLMGYLAWHNSSFIKKSFVCPVNIRNRTLLLVLDTWSNPWNSLFLFVSIFTTCVIIHTANCVWQYNSQAIKNTCMFFCLFVNFRLFRLRKMFRQKNKLVFFRRPTFFFLNLKTFPTSHFLALPKIKRRIYLKTYFNIILWNENRPGLGFVQSLEFRKSVNH